MGGMTGGPMARDERRVESGPLDAAVQQPASLGHHRTRDDRRRGGTGGQIAKLERLQKLRESGALTDSEFEREKAKILSEN